MSHNPADQLPEQQYIFVYGTLKRSVANPMGAMMRSYANYVAEAIIAGRIYDLGPYPGLVLEDSGTAVYGEIYEITKPNALLALLDAYEGCAQDDTQPHEFVRVLATVRDTDGVDYRAWVYVYQGQVDPSWLLPSGYYQPANGMA
ncbi:MAG: gamma-glutamylcyclotransferase [Rhodomicrobium sp.]|nr:MAG: gamma-glutamylcyclotransferase [Rhodomicrobium sp.]